MIKKTALFLLPISLFAFDINFSKSFTKELMPDTLSTNITIRIESKNEQEVSNRLSLFNKEIKRNKAVEKKLGNYNIRPNFKYSSNNTPKIINYIGELRYKVNSDKAKKINQFILNLNALKSSRDTSILVSGLSWKVKEETRNIAYDILRLEAISWSETYAKNLSKDLDKKCNVKSISIGGSTHPIAYRAARSEMLVNSISKASIPVPEANNQKISIHPNYVLECK